jgi:hypothetical protein
MERNPGYIVTFTDKDGNYQIGRTYANVLPVNGKTVVFYANQSLDDTYEDQAGIMVRKKRLIAADRLHLLGFTD